MQPPPRRRQPDPDDPPGAGRAPAAPARLPGSSGERPRRTVVFEDDLDVPDFLK